MPKNFKGLTTLANRLLIVLAVAWIGWTLYKVVNKNYQANQQIDQLKTQISNLQTDNSRLRNAIVYYQTDSFKEVEIRRLLGLALPDEKVVVLPSSFLNQVDPGNTTNVPATSSASATETTNRSKQWWDFFFGSK